MDMEAYRRSALEQERIGSLLSLIPLSVESVMDAGARDGYVSRLLATRCQEVTALDLETPKIDHDQIRCVRGDITELDFEDNSFDMILCAEVLEHLHAPSLAAACSELQRVTAEYLLIGVPYQQDTRLGCTTCYTCGHTNPPWSHVGVFDESKLQELFDGMEIVATALVGSHKQRTNALSTWLMAKAGNPYGTYVQDEPCAHCGSKLKDPPPRDFAQKVGTKLAVQLNELQSRLLPPRPIWIHVLLRKPRAVHPQQMAPYTDYPRHALRRQAV